MCGETSTAFWWKQAGAFADRLWRRIHSEKKAESRMLLVHPPEPGPSEAQGAPAYFQPRIQMQINPQARLQVVNHFAARLIGRSVVKMPEYEQLLEGLRQSIAAQKQQQKKTSKRMHRLEEDAAKLQSRYRTQYLRRQFQKLSLEFGGGEAQVQTNPAEQVLKERRFREEQTEKLRREILKESTKEVSYMMQKSMKEQLNTLTDKVYGKMESRLRDELRRRGH